MRTFILPAGKKVDVIKPDGTRVKDHVIKRDIPMTIRDMGSIERNGYDVDTFKMEGFTIEFLFSQLIETTPCSCGGKGVYDVGMYGSAAGKKWKIKCGPRCTWVKK